MTDIKPSELPRLFELSLTRADATAKDIEELCGKARDQKLYGVGVATSRVELAASLLEDTDLKVTAFIGWPLGTVDSDVKRYETDVAIDLGAQEFEVTLNVGRLKDGDRKYVLRELRDIAEVADERVVKVALRPRMLTREELLLACELIHESGCQFVCLRTIGSPILDEVKLCREALGPKFGIKVGEETLTTRSALALLEAGATRVDVSNWIFPLAE